MTSGSSSASSSGPQTSIEIDAYTKRVWKEIKQVVEESDILLEVLDARDPLGSRCFEIEEWVSGKLLDKTSKKAAAAGGAANESATAKPIILVLNKVDLVPLEVTQQWLDFFVKHDHLPALAFYTNKELEKSEKKGQLCSPKDVCPGAEALLQLINNFQSSNNSNGNSDSESVPQALKVGIVGFGGVGKSSVLNSLSRTHSSGVGTVPGFTKQLHRIKLARGLYAIDTPAVPAKDNAPGPHIYLPIKDAQCVNDVIAWAQHFRHDNLMMVLGLPAMTDEADDEDEDDDSNTATGVLLDHLAQRTGRLMKGGQLNRTLGARRLLKDWNEGKIPYCTLTPDMGDDEDEDDMNDAQKSSIQDFFTACNKRTVTALQARSDLPSIANSLFVNGSLFDDAADEEDTDEDEDEDDEDENEEADDSDDGDDDAEMMENEDSDDDEDGDDDDSMDESDELPPPPPRKQKPSATASSRTVQSNSSQSVQSSRGNSKVAKLQPSSSIPTPKQSVAVASASSSAASVSRKRSSRDSIDTDNQADIHSSSSKKQAVASKQDVTSNKPIPQAKSSVAVAVAASNSNSSIKSKNRNNTKK